jgi:hypothetical protein
MANEITAKTALGVTNGSFKIPIMGNTAFNVSQTVQGGHSDVYTIPASDTVIDTTGMTNEGMARFVNLDATNYVEFGPTVAGAIAPFMKLKPGEENLVRLTPGLVLRGRANTAPVKCHITILED